MQGTARSASGSRALLPSDAIAAGQNDSRFDEEGVERVRDRPCTLAARLPHPNEADTGYDTCTPVFVANDSRVSPECVVVGHSLVWPRVSHCLRAFYVM